MQTERRPGNPQYGTTRRGLVAAAAALAAVLATKKAHAFALPPRDRPRKDPQCFLSGTHILTPQGQFEVERLAIGDLVITSDGAAKPIKWIGRRRIERVSGDQWDGEVLPVRIMRSALTDQVPNTDLYLSPAHALYVDGVLVPVRNLINGHSIAQCDASEFDTIDYFHIELEAHDVIFAEGAPAETLLTRSEQAFDYRSDDASAYEERAAPKLFAPRVAAHGDVVRSRLRSALSPWIDRRQPVDHIWERLAERAETDLAA